MIVTAAGTCFGTRNNAMSTHQDFLPESHTRTSNRIWKDCQSRTFYIQDRHRRTSYESYEHPRRTLIQAPHQCRAPSRLQFVFFRNIQTLSLECPVELAPKFSQTSGHEQIWMMTSYDKLCGGPLLSRFFFFPIPIHCYWKLPLK